MRTYAELLSYGKERLEGVGISDAQIDAWYLLEDICHMDRSSYFLHKEEMVEVHLEEQYERAIKKRESRIPLQQITGTAYFYGLKFYVNEHVLIPRFDTEVLVEEVEKLLKPGMRVLDMCTGSGCILLSLFHENSNLQGVGVDISKEALSVATKNQQDLQLEATFLQGDLFQNVTGTFDVIVSNPPYIKTQVIQGLEEEVKNHEPMLALDGMEDGLYFYRRIIKESACYLKSQGYLCFEIGYDQGAEVEALLEEQYDEIRIIKDLAGLDRVVVARLKKTV